MKCFLVLFFCSWVGLIRAEGYLEASAVYARLNAPAITHRDRAGGIALEGGWRFGPAKRHAVTLGLQAVQWSDAHREIYTVYGNGIEARSVRTRLETLLLGYAWETPLAPEWRLRLGAGAGLGRINDTTESRSLYGPPRPPGPWVRNDGTEPAEACGRVGADIRWHFSSRGHLLMGVEWLRKAAAEENRIYYGPFGAVTATTGKIGIGFRF